MSVSSSATTLSSNSQYATVEVVAPQQIVSTTPTTSFTTQLYSLFGEIIGIAILMGVLYMFKDSLSLIAKNTKKAYSKIKEKIGSQKSGIY